MSMWGGFTGRRRQCDDAELNLIPLIDIMSVLVSFLLIYSANVEVVQNSKGIEIPTSTAETQPKQSVVVMITKDSLYVQGELIAELADIGGDKSGTVIEPLRNVLDRPSVGGDVAADSAAMAEREITVIADKTLPYDVVRRVMATCTAATYGKLSLAVLGKETASTGA